MTGPYDTGKHKETSPPVTEDQINRARHTVARHAKDPEDCHQLLEELGLIEEKKKK